MVNSSSLPVPFGEPSPARLPAEERRLQLIEAAIDVFSRHGFKGTTTKQIAAAAGVTEAIIFRHFATKQQLYTAILDHKLSKTGTSQWVAEVQSLMERRDDPAIFRKLASTIIAIHRTDPKFERVMLYAALEGHELATLHYEQLAAPLGGLLRDYVGLRQSEGALIGVNPKAIILAAVGMAGQYAMNRYVHGYGCEFDDEEAVETFTRILMDGILVRSQS